VDEFEYDRWDSWETAKRLMRLSGGESEIIWTNAAGFVHAKRLFAPSGLWDLTPLSGVEWAWLMVGRDDVGWKATFADGWDEPQSLANRVYDAEGALIVAVDYLTFDMAVQPEAASVESQLAPHELEPPAVPQRELGGYEM
jgi:hypothetical protein